jgi:hypothetical protein
VERRPPSAADFSRDSGARGRAPLHFPKGGAQMTSGLGYFDVSEYGAVSGVPSATAFDNAFADASAAGGVLYFPPGNWIYNGAGFDHLPANGVNAPLYIRGAGMNASHLTFTGVTNAYSIRIGSQSAIGSGNSVGGGVSDIAITFQTTKPGIRIQKLEQAIIENVYTYQSTVALYMDRSRSCLIHNFNLLAWTSNGLWIDDNGGNGSMHSIANGKVNSGAEGSGWACVLIQDNDADTAAPVYDDVTVNSAGQGAFLFQNTGSGTSAIYAIMNNCVADGPFGTAFLFQRVSQVFITNVFAVAHTVAIHLDGADEVVIDGGTVYAGATESSSDFEFDNSCDRLTITGVTSNGPYLGYKTDSTTHTNLFIDNPPTRAATASNDLSKLQSIGQARAFAFSSVDVSLANATNVAIPFDSEIYDYGSFHSTSVNNTRFTAPATGEYRFTAGVSFDSNATGIRRLRFVEGGSLIYGEELRNAVNGDNTTMTLTATIALTKGQYVEVWAYQNRGGALNALASVASPRYMRTFMQVETVKSW